MRYIVAYDVSSNSRRAKLPRLLSRFGYRIQLSVLYLPDVSQEKVDLIYREARKIVDPKRDRVFFSTLDLLKFSVLKPHRPKAHGGFPSYSCKLPKAGKSI